MTEATDTSQQTVKNIQQKLLNVTKVNVNLVKIKYDNFGLRIKLFFVSVRSTKEVGKHMLVNKLAQFSLNTFKLIKE